MTYEIDSTPARPLVRFPFPLDDGVMAHIFLPKDLTRNEAERIWTMLESLAVDDGSVPPSCIANEPDPDLVSYVKGPL